MQVARIGSCRIVAAIGFPEHANLHVVAASADAERVKRLVQIADEVHDELQRGGAIGAIEFLIAETFFPIGDAIDDAIAPAIAA